MRRCVLAFVVSIGCGKGGGSSSSGSATGSGAGTECAPIHICDVLPVAHVDSLCGTRSSKGSPTDTSRTIVTNTCEYRNANGNSTVGIARTCFSSAGDQAKQMFKAVHDDVPRSQTNTDVANVGDEAFYRAATTHTFGVLWVRKGNVLISVQSSYLTAETEEALKTQCLVGLYTELASK